MNHFSVNARRAAAILATAAVTGLIAATAFAASATSGAALASDTGRAPAAVPACTAGDLGVWVAVSQGNGALGTIFYPLQFTNLSMHACTMRGFPGVSAVDSDGHQLGSPASWDHVVPVRTVILAPGATAHTIMGWSDAAVATAPGCDPVFSASELRVYPPGQYGAAYAFFDLEACSHAGPVYLTVEPVLPGVGTVYG